MNESLSGIINRLSKNIDISNYTPSSESKEYDACTFTINTTNVIYRKSKTTPIKVGQFVICWKRNDKGITVPYRDADRFDYFFIHAETDEHSGLFIFPKQLLIQKGIVKNDHSKGKNGFRVFPDWDTPVNKTAIISQDWQSTCFYDLNNAVSIDRINQLLNNSQQV